MSLISGRLRLFLAWAYLFPLGVYYMNIINSSKSKRRVTRVKLVCSELVCIVCMQVCMSSCQS